MCQHMWQELAILPRVSLEINSLGTVQARQRYRVALIDYLQQYEDALNDSEKQRLHVNPMRILDSKNPELADIIGDAPSLIKYLDPESAEHFEGLKALLDAAGIKYRINPHLVRGLDYYSKTVFEWVVPELETQATICAGGRYDGLVEQLGGKPYPAAGFAMGLERIMALLEKTRFSDMEIDAYLVVMGEQAVEAGIEIANQLRNQASSLSVVVNCGGGSIKTQMKRADKSNAKLAIILAEDELRDDTVGIKFLRDKREQETIPRKILASYLNEYLGT